MYRGWCPGFCLSAFALFCQIHTSGGWSFFARALRVLGKRVATALFFVFCALRAEDAMRLLATGVATTRGGMGGWIDGSVQRGTGAFRPG